MGFVGPFPESGDCDYLWVVICRLTSMVHLVPIRTTTTASELAWLYIRKIVCLHGLAGTIVSDRDSKFMSKFWHETHRLLGTKLLMSMSFHPQMDGALEQAICSVAQILWVMVQPDQQDWPDKIPMVEFALNSAISSLSGFAPFELNYRYTPSVNLGIMLEPCAIPGVRHFVECALQNLADVHNTIIESQVCQTYNANRHQHEGDTFMAGDLVFVSTADLLLPKGCVHKLLPKFVGPFKILDAQPSTSTYRVELPAQLQAQNLHNWFHQSKIHPYHANDDALFPYREAHMFYDYGTPDDQEWLVNEIVAHKWDMGHLSFQVHWNMGDTTWEPYKACKDLQALDDYLGLIGIQDPHDLPHKGKLHE